MNWIHAFINSLNDAEVKKLSEIKLIGKEKELADFFISCQNRELPEAEKICKKFQISATHYYKICSVLLNKFYNTLTDAENPFNLFYFLIGKGLYAHFKGAVLLAEKRVLKEKKIDIATFYLNTFHLLLDIPYRFFDEKLRNRFAENYLKYKQNVSIADKEYIKYHCIYNDTNIAAARKNPTRHLKIDVKNLLKNEKKLIENNCYLALYYLYRTICSYYSYFEKNPQEVIVYLQKAIGLKDYIKDFFPVNINHFLNLLYADALFVNNQTAEALAIYRQILESGIEKNMYGYYYHYEQYVLLNIIHEKYSEAERILEEQFQYCIKNKMDIYATRGAMSYAKLFLSKGDYKNAMEYIRIGNNINEKSFYLPFDIQLRVLENIAMLLKGDFSFAKKQAKKNINFVASQKEKQLLKDYLDLWQLIIKLCDIAVKKVQNSNEITKETERLNQIFISLYANLPRIITQQVLQQISN